MFDKVAESIKNGAIKHRELVKIAEHWEQRSRVSQTFGCFIGSKGMKVYRTLTSRTATRREKGCFEPVVRRLLICNLPGRSSNKFVADEFRYFLKESKYP